MIIFYHFFKIIKTIFYPFFKMVIKTTFGKKRNKEVFTTQFKSTRCIHTYALTDCDTQLHNLPFSLRHMIQVRF